MTDPSIQNLLPVVVSDVFSPPAVRNTKKDIALLVSGIILLALSLFLFCFFMPFGVPTVVLSFLATIPGLVIMTMAFFSIIYRKRALSFSTEYNKLKSENSSLKQEIKDKTKKIGRLDTKIKSLISNFSDDVLDDRVWDACKYVIFQNEQLNEELSKCRRN